jgi:catechol 2,3-dioxygenase-like lactoylglutathione lyase family enzyme
VTAHVFHVNVNCSNLDRALGFYRDTIGLTPLTRTTPTAPQPGGAFGLEQVQWDAWILTGADGLEGVALDLLEWHVPPPRQASEPGGFQRLHLHAPLDAAPTADPDDTPIEILPGPSPRLSGLVVGCADLGASAAFYADVVGLDRLDATRLSDDRGPEGFVLELVAAPTPARPRVANDVGIYRLALITDTLDRDYDALLDAGVQPYAAPAALDMGPGLPSLRALFYPDPDGSTLELIERPRPAAPG